MSDTPPDWAFMRADKIWREEHSIIITAPSAVDWWRSAFARYIAAHEDKPVDQLLLPAQAAFRDVPGRSWNQSVEIFRDELAKRGLKIVEA